ncbi:MAG: hypothetical protein COA79_22475 [Planctomycetota bacterium]|nr:MAG: hypothetical protein COA79_22475 [Planctomycetota bacterium]
MSYVHAIIKVMHENGVEESTMMNTPCIRYKGAFIAMMFEKENSLIIKVSPERVNELLAEGVGVEFNFTKKKFKEWVLISLDYESDYEKYIYESLNYAKGKLE